MADGVSIEVCVLGDLEVTGDGVRLDLGGPMLVRVVTVLVAYAPRAVPLDLLIDHLWGDEAPRTADKAVRVHVGRLRRVLGSGAILTVPGGYRFDSPEAIDLHRYEAVMERARSTVRLDPERALSQIEEALHLWRGRPFGALADEEWLTDRVAALEEQHRASEEEHSELLLATGRAAGQTATLRRRVLDEPLRERRWAQLITALHRDGNSAEAARVYEEVRARFDEELGVRPGALVQAAYDEALRQRPDGPLDRLSDNGPIVGREAEIETVEGLLADHRLVSILGIGGIGKSRLAGEVRQRARHRGDVSCVLAVPELTGRPQLVREVAAQLGPGASTEEEAIDSLSKALVGVDLVVLDGCERSLEHARWLVMNLLERRPRVRVLATTREPLGVSAEVAVTLGPLDLPTTTALLERRRGGLDGHLEGDSRRTAGIPLLIELAARSTTPRFVSVDDQSVADSVASMVRPLEPSTRRLAESLALLPGGITAGLAHALVGESSDASLRRLAWLGLVTTEVAGDTIRYDMLDPVRSAIRHGVGDGLEREVVAGACEHLVALGRQVRPGLDCAPDYRILPTLEADAPTLRYLLVGDGADSVTLADGFAEFLSFRGHAAESVGWLSEDLASADRLVAASAVQCAARIGRFGGAVGPFADDLAAAARFFVDTGDHPRATAAALHGVTAYLFRGDVAAAETLLALGSPAASMSEWMSANTEIARGMILAMSGAPLDGRTVLAAVEERLLDMDTGTAALAAYATGLVGSFMLADDAVGDLHRATALAESVGDRPLAALCGAAVLVYQGRHGQPGLPERWQAAASALEHAGLVERAAHARREAGAAFLDGGAREEARAEFAAAARPLVQARVHSAPGVLAALAALVGDDDPSLAARLAGVTRLFPAQFGYPLTPEEDILMTRLLDLAPGAVPPSRRAADQEIGSVDAVLAVLEEVELLVEEAPAHPR